MQDNCEGGFYLRPLTNKMYYILLAIAIILGYFLVVRFISTLLKVFLVIFGIIILVGGVYVMILSSSQKVELFGIYTVENFQIRKISE